MSENLCRFCDIASGRHTLPENVPFIENDQYFSIASVGAMVEGWILVVPKTHSCSMKDVYSRSDFADFTTTIIKKMQENYGHLVAFEHGPNKMNSETSCGTNHAHLHIVPISDSLISDMRESGMLWEECKAKDIPARVKDQEYLFYCDLPNDGIWENPTGFLHVLDKSISQYFRRIIAKRLGCEDQFNYKTNPNTQLTQYTAKVLSEYFIRESK